MQWSSNSFTVVGKNGTSINAKYLKGLDGSFIIDPNSKTSEPYIVPQDFSLAAFESRYLDEKGVRSFVIIFS